MAEKLEKKEGFCLVFFGERGRCEMSSSAAVRIFLEGGPAARREIGGDVFLA